MENTELVQDQGPQIATEDTPLAMDSSIPTPVESVEGSPAALQGETVPHSEVSLTPSEADSNVTPDQQQQPQQSSQPIPIKALVPSHPPQLKRRPRRTGQPLHLLLQDCSKQHITGYICKKTPEEITAIVTEKKTLAADLRTFSNEFVLTSARDRVISEVDDEGKELLKDVDPERDVIKQRFEDESSVFKAYEDAIHDIRVDLYLDGIKPRKSETDEEREETAARNAELNAVLQVWDTLHKRVEVEPRRAGRSTQGPYPTRGGRAPGPPGSRSHPYAPNSRLPPSSPHYGPPPFAGPPHAGPPFRDSRSHHRDYHDRPPYRDDYYGDRRDDHRRPDYDRRDPRDYPMGVRPPAHGPMGRSDPRDIRDPRDPRDFRDRGPPLAARGEAPYGAGRYDDRRRDRADMSNAPPPRDNRHHGSAGASASPLTAHPSLPPKPPTSQYDTNAGPPQHMQAANPMYSGHYPPGAHQHPPQVDPATQAYGAYGHPGHPGYPVPGQADYSSYPYGYGQDPTAQQQMYGYTAATAGGWDISGATAATVGHVGAGLHLQPFSSSQHGRHKAVPLPTDFMSGPSDAPRLSMPEPHEVLGTIRGVIIRDAHGKDDHNNSFVLTGKRTGKIFQEIQDEGFGDKELNGVRGSIYFDSMRTLPGLTFGYRHGAETMARPLRKSLHFRSRSLYPAPDDSSAERLRLKDSDVHKNHWMRWGPYLSERQWATVREDYSGDGDAWRFFPHDQARSRAYRWGEDGLAGVSDNHQRFCMALALWNGKDKILKERLFGLTNHEGNHGEDVKELYYYLDNTPTHSYMKYLYKYPQAEFPYDHLVAENARRDRKQPEYELIDTGIFNEDKYFDVFVEYAKDGKDVDDVFMKITAFNRGKQDAPLHIIPQFWFRNTWAWFPEGEVSVPWLEKSGDRVIEADHDSLGKRWVHFEVIPGVGPELIFTNNETNIKKVFNTPQPNKCPYSKDGFHEYIINGNKSAINRDDYTGTKAAGVYKFANVPAGGKVEVRVRLNKKPPGDTKKGDPNPGVEIKAFDNLIQERIKEADEFYERLALKGLQADLKMIQRQALAGMLWTKQFYHFIHRNWRKGDPVGPPPPPERLDKRNKEWKHLYIDDILSMPDKWEYPFFAAWDMAFHTIPLSLVDPSFAKKQLDLLTREWYMHPSGQIPAYEWNFSDVNPPVHAWATLQVYKTEYRLYGNADRLFLERVFQKLLLNFTWWVNRKDREGNNVFEGGFLGLDNIGLFNRSEPLPNGAILRQADGTSWMVFFCLCMLHIALELAKDNVAYEDIASKFLEHFFHISDAMTYHSGHHEKSLWDTTDKFFYDSISWPGGHTERLKTRSLVGLIPLFSVLSLDPEYVDLFPGFKKRLNWLLDYREKNRPSRIFKKEDTKENGSILLALVDQTMLRAVLARLLDENEFLSPYGVRSLSKYHKDHPLSMWMNGQEFRVDYLPAESDSGMFGGNSNWRGPIWFPTNYLLICSLKRLHYFYGSDFKVECPTGSGIMKNLLEVAWELEVRLVKLVQQNKQGQRPANGGVEKLDKDQYFKDLVLFYEYFDAENGKGLGANHQTGWTGLLAVLVHQVGTKCHRS
ncbi:hypothetical protein FBU30_009857 [Linnemannia zychae]|nr:hypothetical protein FBU30_009857 [Linnemannia zychae]